MQNFLHHFKTGYVIFKTQIYVYLHSSPIVLEAIANSKPIAKTALDFLRVVPPSPPPPPSTPQSRTPLRNSIAIFEKFEFPHATNTMVANGKFSQLSCM